MKKLVYLVASIALMSACRKANEYLPPAFNYKIEPVTITANVNTGAYYYNYTAADWAKKYTNTPMLGEYNALNAATMAQHRKWADEGGVDFFVFNWNGAAAGDPVVSSFIQGRSEQVKMVINYNTAHLSASNASPLSGAKLNTMLNELKTLSNNHFSKDYYYKLDGKPVIMITPLNLAANAAASIDYTMVIPAMKTALSAIGIDVYIIGEIAAGWLPPARYATTARIMDAVTTSNWATDVYDRSAFFASFSDMNWKNWTDSTAGWKTDFVPCIFPGYNDKAMTPASKMYDVGGTAAFYEDYCNVAKRNMSANRLVLINSWNHFQLGTSLEPSKEYGNTYLEITKKQFKIK